MSFEESLTVVIPVYNRAAVVERTLDSVAAQTLRPLSVVLVDNNSTDDTARVLERWAMARRSSSLQIIVTTETTPGAAAARNCGLRLATGSVVMFFDSDDVMSPHLCSAVVDAFRADRELGIVGWDVDITRADGSMYTRRFIVDGRPVCRALIHGQMSTARYAARRSLFIEAGGWNESVGVWDDLDLGLRLLSLNPAMGRVGIRNAVTVYYSEMSITAQADSRAVSPEKEPALDCCEDTLAVSGNVCGLRWVDYRRVLLAAEYASRGDREAARRLLQKLRWAPRWVCRLLYVKHRLFSRGTYLLAPFRRI